MRKRNSTWIADWNPEDETFWKSTGRSIAQRNLIWSIFAEHLGFSIWLLWSIVATKLPQAGFPYTTDQLFQLVALPGLALTVVALGVNQLGDGLRDLLDPRMKDSGAGGV